MTPCQDSLYLRGVCVCGSVSAGVRRCVGAGAWVWVLGGDVGEGLHHSEDRGPALA